MKRVKEYAYTKMPWGKYKGHWLKDIPDEYLLWCVENWRDQTTSEMFKTELARRKINWQQAIIDRQSKARTG